MFCVKRIRRVFTISDAVHVLGCLTSKFQQLQYMKAWGFSSRWSSIHGEKVCRYGFFQQRKCNNEKERSVPELCVSLSMNWAYIVVRCRTFVSLSGFLSRGLSVSRVDLTLCVLIIRKMMAAHILLGFQRNECLPVSRSVRR